MSKNHIKNVIESRIQEDGMMETGVKGVKLFRATKSIPCAPAVFEPCVIAIVAGEKEAVIDGKICHYDNSQYMCCPMSMPVKAGTPAASPDNPLYGVYISLDTRVMTELAVEIENTMGATRPDIQGTIQSGITFAQWGDDFSDALLRLVQLGESATHSAVLGEGRLREVYYAVLNGDAGFAARRAFGVGNEITRAIRYLTTHLNDAVTIEDLADHVGMSRAVFHRKFKQATTMSPIQFIKSMRLNNAAVKIAGGKTVSEAALDVGYVSASQFSREFKRLYGESPRQWTHSQHFAGELM